MAGQGGALVTGLVIGVAIGGGGAFLAFGGKSDPAPGLGTSAPGTAPAAAPAPGTAPAPLPGSSPGPAAPAPDLSGIGAAIAAVPRPGRAQGSGRLQGRVALADGTPVSGVLLRFTWMDDDSPDEPSYVDGPGERMPSDPDLRTQLLNIAKYHHQVRSRRFDATSGADGSFVVDGVPEGKYRPRAFKRGFEFTVRGTARDRWGRTGGWLGVVKTGDTLEVEAVTVIAVPVQVLLPDGSAPAEAGIEVTEQSTAKRRQWGDHSGGARRRWRPDPGTLGMLPGTWYLTAVVPGPGGPATELRSAELRLTLRAGEPPPPVTLQLTSQPGITGVISAADGVLPDHVALYHARMPATPPADPAAWLKEQGNPQWISSDDRRYTLRDLRAGRWLLGVARINNGPVELMAVVDVADRMVEHDLVLPAPDPAQYVRVRIFDSKGKPVTNVRFGAALRGPSRGGSSSSGFSGLTRPDGEIWVPLEGDYEKAWRTGKTEGDRKLFFTIESEQFGEREFPLTPGTPMPLVIRLREPATVLVTVRGYAESPVAEYLSLQLVRGDADLDRAAMTMGRRFGNAPAIDAEGRQRLGPVEPGEYLVLVSVQPPGQRWRGALPAGRHPLTLQSGENLLTIDMPRVHDVVIRIPGDRVEGDGVTLAPAAGNRFLQREAKLGEDGTARFAGVPDGKYRITRQRGGRESMLITVPGQVDVELRDLKPNAIRVTVDDPGGLLAAIGFLTGDRIVGARGMDFAKSPSAVRMFQYSPERMLPKLGPFTVLRGGQTVELAVPDELKQGAAKALGGTLEPERR